MDITYEARILYVFLFMFKYVCIIYHYNYGGSHASDILHVLMAYVTNHVLLCVMRPHLVAKSTLFFFY